jgi:hypothetical protein
LRLNKLSKLTPKQALKIDYDSAKAALWRQENKPFGVILTLSSRDGMLRGRIDFDSALRLAQDIAGMCGLFREETA